MTEGNDIRIAVHERVEDYIELTVTREGMRTTIEWLAPPKDGHPSLAMALFDKGAPLRITVIP